MPNQKRDKGLTAEIALPLRPYSNYRLLEAAMCESGSPTIHLRSPEATFGFLEVTFGIRFWFWRDPFGLPGRHV